MIERKGHVPDLDFDQIVGRDPIGKTITETFIERHPDWSDQQITDRVNAEAGGHLLDASEVAHWRMEVAR